MNGLKANINYKRIYINEKIKVMIRLTTNEKRKNIQRKITR